MRYAVVALSLLGCSLSIAPAATAQTEGTLRSKISQLFIFASGQEPLVLGGSIDPNNPASIQAHGNHFKPSAVAENGSLIGFITSAISTSEYEMRRNAFGSSNRNSTVCRGKKFAMYLPP